MIRPSRRHAAALLLVVSIHAPSLLANTTPQPLPFSQNWTDTGLITSNDDWSGVPGIVGYRGDSLTGSTGTDPQTILADGSATPVDVNANQTHPDTYTAGGVTEFQIADPAVALNGSGTADAPHLVIYLTTTGLSGIHVAYTVRDLDGSADDATQQVALQYRVGGSGDYINVPAGYVADATDPNSATKTTAISTTLPADADNQSLLEVRVISTNAPGNDEWVGIDDIAVSSGVDAAPRVSSVSPGAGAVGVLTGSTVDVTFSEPVSTSTAAFALSCGGGVQFQRQ